MIISINSSNKNMYEKNWSSATPGMLVLVVNDANRLCCHIANRAIDMMIQMNFNGDAPKNRCFISVIGYSHNVKELGSGLLTYWDENYIRYETLKKKMPDGAGGICEIEVKQPIWVEPITQDGATNMLGAFGLAKELVEKWIADNPDGPAPVIINISDGVPYYDGKDPRIYMEETVAIAQDIMEMSHSDGNILIYNIVLDDTVEYCLCCPSCRTQLSNENESFFYDISSIIPSTFKDRYLDLKLDSESRGCLFRPSLHEILELFSLINIPRFPKSFYENRY